MKKKRQPPELPVIATFSLSFGDDSDDLDSDDLESPHFEVNFGSIAQNVFKSQMREQYYAALQADPDLFPEDLISDLIEGTESDAEAAIEQAEEEGEPTKAAMARLMATAARELGDELMTSDVIEPLQHELRTEPNNPALYHQLAQAYAILGRYLEAVDLLKKAARLDPTNPEILYDLGHAELGKEEFNSAKATFARLIRMVPTSPSGFSGLASVYQSQEKYQEAANAMSQAVERAPELAPLRLRFGYLLILAGDLMAARAQHQALIPLDPDGAETLLKFIESNPASR